MTTTVPRNARSSGADRSSFDPVSITDSGVYNVNNLYSAFGILRPGSKLPASGFTFDQTGQPSIFANTNAVTSLVGDYPGTVGTRDILRGLSAMNDHAAVFKYFKLPKEGMRFSIRAEAFNSTNRVNFGAPSLSLATPTAFGEVATPTTARVMQFAGHLDF